MLELQKTWNDGEFLAQLVAAQLELLRPEFPLPELSKHSDVEAEKRRHEHKLLKRAEAELLQEISKEQSVAVGRAMHLPGYPLVRIRPEIAPELELASDRNWAQWRQEKYDRVRIKRTVPLAQVSNESNGGPSEATPKAGGRPNTKEEVKALVRLRLRDPKFSGLANRTEQAIEIRVELKGEDARQSHDMSGYKTETIKRWIGEVEAEP